MKTRSRGQPETNSLDLIEEAVHLLRACPLTVMASYYLGTLPFVLGALYFWADMSASPFAPEHLAGAAFGLAVLFLWMKFWQAVFGRSLTAALTGESSAPLRLASCGCIASAQILLHAVGLFVLPLSAVTLVGFPWVYAFFQNTTVLQGREPEALGTFVQRCAKQACLWPAQNCKVIAVLAGFGVAVWLNWGTVCFAAPALVKLLLGVESIFTRSGFSLLNSTFFAVVFGLTYLSTDPVVKAVYALRGFYGESLESGQDLKAELVQIRRLTEGSAVVLLISLLAMADPGTVVGQVDGLQMAAQGTSNISSGELDRAITTVVQQRKYAWRMPREKVIETEDAEEGFFGRLLARIGKFCWQVLKSVSGWIERFLRHLLPRHWPTSPDGSGYGWILLEELLLYGLLAGAVIGLVFLILRTWSAQRSRAAALTSVPIESAPDLADQNVGAEQMPEDGWTRLARELWAQGELRLALRAFYFASLANLADRNLIRLAKFKSNRDYERELLRREHAIAALASLFSENVSVFDRIWYGMQEISSDRVEQFAANVEKLRSAQA